MKFLNALPVLLLAYIDYASGVKIVLTNDDGWAVAQIRAQYDALKSAGHDVRRSYLIPPLVSRP
jgi:5'-nucleotidase